MAKIVRFSDTVTIYEDNGTIVTRTVVTTFFVTNIVQRPPLFCSFDLYATIFEQHNNFIDQVRRFIIEKANHSPGLFIEDEEDDESWGED